MDPVEQEGEGRGNVAAAALELINCAKGTTTTHK